MALYTAGTPPSEEEMRELVALVRLAEVEDVLARPGPLPSSYREKMREHGMPTTKRELRAWAERQKKEGAP